MGLFGKKKIENNQGTAVWVDEVGTISLRIFNVVEDSEGYIQLDFGNGEKYLIKRTYLRKKRVVIYKLHNGKIQVQNPDKWKDIPLKKYGIKELRFNLQNFAMQESKASIHRWTLPPDTITKLSPLFKLLLICIAIGVLGWSAFKFAGIVFQNVMSSRIMDCVNLIPKSLNPIGANFTAPIG